MKRYLKAIIIRLVNTVHLPVLAVWHQNALGDAGVPYNSK